MLAQPFLKPVHVWVGLGFPRQLNTVFDASQFALEWGGNSPEQRAAIRALKSALAGDVEPETARGVFVAFARAKDILVEDATIAVWGKEHPSWPAAGFVDTEIRCLTELESGNATKEVQPRVQA